MKLQSFQVDLESEKNELRAFEKDLSAIAHKLSDMVHEEETGLELIETDDDELNKHGRHRRAAAGAGVTKGVIKCKSKFNPTF